MSAAFIGSESVTAGVVTPYVLRTRYVPIHPGVYVPRNTAVDAVTRAEAAWLWSRRRGVVAGLSAAALHGSKWVDPGSPAELLYGNRHRPRGIRTYADQLAKDEVVEINRMHVTTPARTALDLACRNPMVRAVAAIDALANATDLKVADVELLAKDTEAAAGSHGSRRRLISSMPALSHRVKPGYVSCCCMQVSRGREHKFPCTTSSTN